MNGGPSLSSRPCPRDTSHDCPFCATPICTGCGSVPLVVAAGSGNMKVVEYLLNHGAAIEATGNPHGCSAFMAAIGAHRFDLALRLLKLQRIKAPGLRPIHFLFSYACTSGSINAREALKLAWDIKYCSQKPRGCDGRKMRVRIAGNTLLSHLLQDALITNLKAILAKEPLRPRMSRRRERQLNL